MELFVLFALLGALALLAPRFGHDSTDTVRSREAELAALGFRWGPSEPSHQYPRNWSALAGSCHQLLELDVIASRLAERRREAELWRLVREARRPSPPLRHRLALVLLELAEWLAPQLASQHGGAGHRGLAPACREGASGASTALEPR